MITEGIDIVISMDISGSMLAQDLKPDRLEASKNVAMNFISGRPNDRIGLVIFSGESFTQCPLTTDHQVLQNLFANVKSGMVEDGTAIGMGLATAVNRLKESEAISKVIILLTDGVNNQGSVAPLTAAKIAQKFGIRVYTIGVGTKGYAPYPFKTPFGTTVYQDVEVQIDEETLQNIASVTNGQYFRATSNKALESIYREIDQLERSKIEIKEYHKKKEEFFPLALLALTLLIIEFALRHTIFRSIT
jgi:Ca-activated chloride channel family protein